MYHNSSTNQYYIPSIIEQLRDIQFNTNSLVPIKMEVEMKQMENDIKYTSDTHEVDTQFSPVTEHKQSQYSNKHTTDTPHINDDEINEFRQQYERKLSRKAIKKLNRIQRKKEEKLKKITDYADKQAAKIGLTSFIHQNLQSVVIKNNESKSKSSIIEDIEEQQLEQVHNKDNKINIELEQTREIGGYEDEEEGNNIYNY